MCDFMDASEGVSMFVCVRMYVHECSACVRIYVLNVYEFKNECMRIRLYECMHVHMYLFMCVRMHIRTLHSIMYLRHTTALLSPAWSYASNACKYGIAQHSTCMTGM